MDVVIASKNEGKVKEIQAAFQSLPLRLLSLNDFEHAPDAVEDGLTFMDNALIKARHYAKYTGKACLADDSGLEVDALGGAPGVYSARYAGPNATDAENNAKLLKALAGQKGKRAARFRCSLAFFDPSGQTITADGCLDGEILDAPRGGGGFGYDPLFYLGKLQKTMAELTIDEKNQISHRGLALEAMAEKLAGNLR